MNQAKSENPLGIKILAWYGNIFGSIYILVALVNIVLSILDRTYKDLGNNFIIGLYGIPILIFSIGFKNHKKWGWIGYSSLLVLVIIWSTISYHDPYNLAISILSLIALAGLLLPSVRSRFFPG
jgi:hypothetical protein